jgi:exodeoxyribonuclease V beta subunit
VGGGQAADRPPASAAGLAALLEQHRCDGIDPTYPDRLRSLDWEAFSGFLSGTIDLLFEHDGRFGVVDFKTNHLGATFEAYRPEALVHRMAEHHYVLQALLYAVAVHRFLRIRRPGYDYERHFGGLYWLFVRGMTPATGPATGIWRTRPPLALIEAIDRWLDGR